MMNLMNSTVFSMIVCSCHHVGNEGISQVVLLPLKLLAATDYNYEIKWYGSVSLDT